MNNRWETNNKIFKLVFELIICPSKIVVGANCERHTPWSIHVCCSINKYTSGAWMQTVQMQYFRRCDRGGQKMVTWTIVISYLDIRSQRARVVQLQHKTPCIHPIYIRVTAIMWIFLWFSSRVMCARVPFSLLHCWVFCYKNSIIR